MVLAERLGEFGIPALVVTGETDISTPFAGHGDRLLRALPDARHDQKTLSV
jgi:3-oxoadipate enol-lactonase/4-carboxymuconolactone decarboxylase